MLLGLNQKEVKIKDEEENNGIIEVVNVNIKCHKNFNIKMS